MKKIHTHPVFDILVIIAGTFIFALSVYVFTAPNDIAPGGVTGLSTALHSLFPAMSLGTFAAVINIPILISGYRFLGKRFFAKTVLSTILFTLFYDYIFPYFIPQYKGDFMLAALFGGILSGAGLALVFIRGGSTGGMDVINKMISRKIPNISMGRLVFISDALVIAFAAFVFGNIESALYAVVSMVVATKTIDSIIYGMDIGRLVFIVTDTPKAITDKIAEKINRGATIIGAKGSYTEKNKNVVMCVVSVNQFYKLKRIVFEIDPGAFMTVTQTNEAVGEGFKSHMKA